MFEKVIEYAFLASRPVDCGSGGGAPTTTPCGGERGFQGLPTTRSVSVSHCLEGVLVIEHPTDGADGVGVPLVEVGVHGQVHTRLHSEGVVTRREVFHSDAFGLGELLDGLFDDGVHYVEETTLVLEKVKRFIEQLRADRIQEEEKPNGLSSEEWFHHRT